jgi:hypothetical protein
MDEEQKTEPKIIEELKEKAAIESQLDSYINPSEAPKTNSNIIPEQTPEIKAEPLIKIKDESEIPPPEIKKQTRPIIRTYKSDVEETIQAGHISSINIALAENKKMIGQERKTEVGTKKQGINKIIIIISLILVFGGALTIFIPQLLINMQFGPKKVPVETISSQPIITADLEEEINLDTINQNRLSTTLQERVDESSTQLGQLENIFLTEGTSTNEKLVTASEFLQLINADVPSQIELTLKDPYMFGLYNYNGNQRFLILKVGDYDTAFSGMLSWETDLWQNFKELFELPDNSALYSSSSLSTAIKFQDYTIDNKDCRVVEDSSGNIVFLYSIIDQNTIVITTSVNTLEEIINRVSKARVVTQ